MDCIHTQSEDGHTCTSCGQFWDDIVDDNSSFWKKRYESSLNSDRAGGEMEKENFSKTITFEEKDSEVLRKNLGLPDGSTNNEIAVALKNRAISLLKEAGVNMDNATVECTWSGGNNV